MTIGVCGGVASVTGFCFNSRLFEGMNSIKRQLDSFSQSLLSKAADTK